MIILKFKKRIVIKNDKNKMIDRITQNLKQHAQEWKKFPKHNFERWFLLFILSYDKTQIWKYS